MENTKKSTAILSEEHRHILKVIDRLIKECDGLRAGNEINKSFFEEAIDFIRNYADKFHHAKEEDILFVELCKDTVEMHCNPTSQMLHEHDLGRGFVKELEEGVKSNDKEKVIEGALGYAQLLQEHIFKEDNILYPMADQALSEDIQQVMLDEFARVEKEKFGEEIIKKYLDFAEELEKK